LRKETSVNSHKVHEALINRRKGLMYFQPGMTDSEEARRTRAITIFNDFYSGTIVAREERVVVGSAANFLARCAKKLVGLPPCRSRLGPLSPRRPAEVEAEAMSLAAGACLEFLRDILSELASESRQHMLVCFRRLASRLKKIDESKPSPYGRGMLIKDLGTIQGYFDRAK